jgi:hypothetical protein
MQFQINTKQKKIVKYLIALILLLIGIGVLIAGIVLSNTPMIVLGFFTFIAGVLITLFLYLHKD